MQEGEPKARGIPRAFVLPSRTDRNITGHGLVCLLKETNERHVRAEDTMRISLSVLVLIACVTGCSPSNVDPCSRYAVDIYAACACIQEEQTYLDEVAAGCCDEELVALREMECGMERRRVDACEASSSREDTGDSAGSTCDADTSTCDLVDRCATASCVAPTCDPIPPT